jgi:hypothetical protein
MYKVIRVWPPPNVNVDPRGKASFAISPGVYEYPFEFKVRSPIVRNEAHGQDSIQQHVLVDQQNPAPCPAPQEPCEDNPSAIVGQHRDGSRHPVFYQRHGQSSVLFQGKPQSGKAPAFGNGF